MSHSKLQKSVPLSTRTVRKTSTIQSSTASRMTRISSSQSQISLKKSKNSRKKFKKDEEKKVDKQVKRDLNEWEDIYSGNPSLSTNAKGLQTLGDRLTKIMNDSVKKSLKNVSRAEDQRSTSLEQRDTILEDLKKATKVRNTLELMCKAILQKNHDLYLKHENMLDTERVARSSLAVDFQTRMGEVTKEINDLKEERQTEF